jgi:hypothetical protein
MRDDMTCARAHELMSDHLENTLGEPLRGEIDEHLAACPECRALREDLAFVVDALHAYPELEPSPTLAARAAEAALRAGKVAAFPSPPRSRKAASPARWVPLPAWAQSLAAGLALVTLGLLLLTTRSEAPARAAARIASATLRTGAYLVERKDRLVEDVRVLRVVIETAFENRVDRVNERVEDYRRLLERRKAGEPSDEDTSAGSKKTNDLHRTFPNRRSTPAVA